MANTRNKGEKEITPCLEYFGPELQLKPNNPCAPRSDKGKRLKRHLGAGIDLLVKYVIKKTSDI